MSRKQTTTRYCDFFGCIHAAVLDNNDKEWSTMQFKDNKGNVRGDAHDLCSKHYVEILKLIFGPDIVSE